jgi:hypothetical protein
MNREFSPQQYWGRTLAARRKGLRLNGTGESCAELGPSLPVFFFASVLGELRGERRAELRGEL